MREDEPSTKKTQTFSRFFAGITGTIRGSAALNIYDTAVAVDLPATTLLNGLFHHPTGALHTGLGCGDGDSEAVGLVEVEKRGLNVFYRLRCPCLGDFFRCVDSINRGQMDALKRAAA